jgi:hypothetical protein
MLNKNRKKLEIHLNLCCMVKHIRRKRYSHQGWLISFDPFWLIILLFPALEFQLSIVHSYTNTKKAKYMSIFSVICVGFSAVMLDMLIRKNSGSNNIYESRSFTQVLKTVDYVSDIALFNSVIFLWLACILLPFNILSLLGISVHIW